MQRVIRRASGVAICLTLATCAATMSSTVMAQPAPRPAQPASQPAATQTTMQAATTAPAKITLNFKDAPLDTVLDYLSQSAGFVIIRDGVTDGRVTILSKQPVSSEEAITLVNA